MRISSISLSDCLSILPFITKHPLPPFASHFPPLHNVHWTLHLLLRIPLLHLDKVPFGHPHVFSPKIRSKISESNSPTKSSQSSIQINLPLFLAPLLHRSTNSRTDMTLNSNCHRKHPRSLSLLFNSPAIRTHKQLRPELYRHHQRGEFIDQSRDDAHKTTTTRFDCAGVLSIFSETHDVPWNCLATSPSTKSVV